MLMQVNYTLKLLRSNELFSSLVTKQFDLAKLKGFGI